MTKYGMPANQLALTRARMLKRKRKRKRKKKVYTGFATGVDNGRQPAPKGRPSRLMWRGAAPPRGRAKLRRPLEGLVNVVTVQLASTHNQAVRVIERHVDPSTYNARDSRCGNPNGCHSRKRIIVDRAGNSKSNSVIFSTPTHVLQLHICIMTQERFWLMALRGGSCKEPGTRLCLLHCHPIVFAPPINHTAETIRHWASTMRALML